MSMSASVSRSNEAPPSASADDAAVASGAIEENLSTTATASTTPAAGGKRPTSARNLAKSVSMDNDTAQRRSSSRSIKRKKFDDELVESSISYPKNTRARNLSTSAVPLTPTTPVAPSPAKCPPSAAPSAAAASTSAPPASAPAPPAPDVPDVPEADPPAVVEPPPPVEEQKAPAPSTSTKRSSRPAAASASTRRRRHRNALNNAIKDLGRWKPQDDLLLVLGVQQTNDLETVYRGVKFSCKFTIKEIEDRWYALLYDPTIAKIGVAAMRQLHPETVAAVHRKVLFSEDEERALKTVAASSNPTIETFEELLLSHPKEFLSYRTAKCLQNHWTLMKQYQLLPDQAVTPLPRHEEVTNFSDAEDIIERDTIKSIQSGQLQKQALPGLGIRQDDLLAQELVLADRKAKREIRQLENEIPKWQVLVDSITGVAPSDFDNQTLAVLRGRLVRYLMRSREVTLGRCTADSIVDVDLSLEGPAFKISRKQGLIKLQPNGDFMIANTGKRPFYVDSKPVLADGVSVKLNNNSVVEVSGLRFVFLINQDLVTMIRADQLKMSVANQLQPLG